ncbi:MAG TPA: hypothetical protein VKU83_06060 [Puia sp.]|nr:hypothetical protein [Puia sp.]
MNTIIRDEERQRLHRDYLREVDPFIRELSNILHLAPCSYFINATTGEIEKLPYPAEIQKLVDEINGFIESITSKYQKLIES